MKMRNGALEFEGVEGTRDHYENRIWRCFVERLNVLRFASSETIVAIEMWTNIKARAPAETLFGPVAGSGPLRSAPRHKGN